MVGKNPARGWFLKGGSPFPPFGEQARLSEEVRSHASRQGIHGWSELHGKNAERGNLNRGFLRERLYSGHYWKIGRLEVEGIQGLVAVPYSGSGLGPGEGFQDNGWRESDV